MSESTSILLGSDLFPSSVIGAGEERGGGKVASLIVVEFHNILMCMIKDRYRKQYTKYAGRLFVCCWIN